MGRRPGSLNKPKDTSLSNNSATKSNKKNSLTKGKRGRPAKIITSNIKSNEVKVEKRGRPAKIITPLANIPLSKQTLIKKSSVLPHLELNLSKVEILKALRLMITSRLTDEKHLTLVKQGKSFFHIGGSGHECIQVAMALSMKPEDWGWTYYRDMAFSYAKGMTTRDYFLLAFAKKDCPATGGRQMPGHFGNPALNMPTQSSPTGTQFLNATGCALASLKSGTNEITYVASGDGTTSQGEFYEAVNWANREKLPIVFCIQDNGYAISVLRKDQSMGTSVSDGFGGYKNLKKMHIDGTNYFDSIRAAREAVSYMRSGSGPVLLHADVERLLPHSSSDDHRKYRDADELAEIANKKDCIKILTEYLTKNKVASIKEIDELWIDVKKEINDAADWAWEQPDPIASESLKEVFADISTRNLPYATEEPISGVEAVLVDGINHALKEEMARNPKMLIFGEDIADPKGGVFTSTRGLSDMFGEKRVFNSPLAEASIVGVALGLAVRGYKPVIEIQFGDYIWPAFMQYKNEIATMRYRSNGGFSSAVVTRVAVGGYIHGGLCHSQNIESIFSHIPGILIAYPSNAADAKGLLKTACRLQDPVIFCEHKGMYRLPFAKAFEGDENYLIPFGKGKIVKEGTSATVVTYGMGVKDSLNAAKRIEKDFGKTIEVIDLRTIVPWDRELVLASIKKTNRALIVHEDTMQTGFGAEIVATIADDSFHYLDAPVRRLCAKDSHIPYHPNFEDDVLPSENKVYDELVKLLNF
jgi:2-oxoisovalerate dehydrogenase E1 component